MGLCPSFEPRSQEIEIQECNTTNGNNNTKVDRNCNEMEDNFRNNISIEVSDSIENGLNNSRTSSKTRKFLRISPKLKKKNSRKEEENTMKEMASQGKSKKINDKIPNGLNDKERLELKQTFDLFDKNQDGRISSEELGCVLRTLGHDYTAIEVEEMIKNADTNENGYVEYDEFLQLMKRWSTTNPPGAAAVVEPELTDEQKQRETFKIFDMDGNGYIDEHELRYVMRRLGENLQEADVKAMFQLADLNGDGLIDYEEFNKLMGGLTFPVVPKGGAKSSPPKSSKKESSKK